MEENQNKSTKSQELALTRGVGEASEVQQALVEEKAVIKTFDELLTASELPIQIGYKLALSAMESAISNVKNLPLVTADLITIVRTIAAINQLKSNQSSLIVDGYQYPIGDYQVLSSLKFMIAPRVVKHKADNNSADLRERTNLAYLPVDPEQFNKANIRLKNLCRLNSETYVSITRADGILSEQTGWRDVNNKLEAENVATNYLNKLNEFQLWDLKVPANFLVTTMTSAGVIRLSGAFMLQLFTPAASSITKAD